MNYAKLQLRAGATALVLFSVSSLALFLLVRGVGNIASVLPLPKPLPSYSPGDTIGALLDLKPVIAMAAATLLALAIVVLIRNAFLDRAVHMFVSMLVLLLASSLGIVIGFGAYLSINARHLIVPGGLLPGAVCLAILMAVSCFNLDTLRASWVLRTILAPVLAIGAPLLLIYGS